MGSESINEKTIQYTVLATKSTRILALVAAKGLSSKFARKRFIFRVLKISMHAKLMVILSIPDLSRMNANINSSEFLF